MAGKPGRSGGARPNTGGARPGAGRPRKEAVILQTQPEATTLDPKSFLMAVLNNPDADGRLRIEAAKALLPFMYPKIREEGKKEGQQEAAKQASKGRFSRSEPPVFLRAVKSD